MTWEKNWGLKYCINIENAIIVMVEMKEGERGCRAVLGGTITLTGTSAAAHLSMKIEELAISGRQRVVRK